MVRIVPLNEPAEYSAGTSAGSGGSEGLLHALPAVVLQCAADGRILFVSDNWRALTGRDAGESRGRNLLEFIHPEDHSLVEEHFAAVLPVGQVNQTLRHVTPDGRTGWVLLDLHESRLDDGSGGYVGLVTDITDRVGREASLLAQHRTLSGILDDLPGMVFRCRNDPDWTMEYVSGGSLALTGYRPGEIINNRRLSYGSLIVAEDRDRVWNGVQMAIHERRGYDLDYRIETESGAVRDVWERGKGIYSPGNDLLGLEGFITDITRYRQRFHPLKPADLYLERGGAITRVLLEDRLRHRLRRLRRDRAMDNRGAGFGVVCLYFDNLGKQLEGADDRLHARILDALVQRTSSLCSPADSIHIDVTGQILMLLDEIPDRDSMESLAGSLQAAYFDALEVDGLQILLTLSIGAAYCDDPEAGENAISSAEETMRQLRETGGNHWRVSRCEQ